jgi:hypothetical protein
MDVLEFHSKRRGVQSGSTSRLRAPQRPRLSSEELQTQNLARAHQQLAFVLAQRVVVFHCFAAGLDKIAKQCGWTESQ